jgi:hypothetical protein
VVQELDELRAVIQEHRKHLNDNASLREIVGLLLQGDTSTAQVCNVPVLISSELRQFKTLILNSEVGLIDW